MQLTARGITFWKAACPPEVDLDPREIERLITPGTKLVLTTHASNVCGTVTPIREIAEICRARRIRYAIDAAQAAGVLPIDAVCFTGHKGLLGPQGISGILFTGDFSNEILALDTGDTGSSSDLETMPEIMPDRLEAGTPNLPGIIGVGAGIGWINKKGIDVIREHELKLTDRFIEGIAPLEKGWTRKHCRQKEHQRAHRRRKHSDPTP